MRKLTMLRIRWRPSLRERLDDMRAYVAALLSIALLVAGPVVGDQKAEIAAKAKDHTLKISGEVIHSWPEGGWR